MSTAVLYIRVSTDEQAIKGYSQRSQKERLTKFCQLHNVEILDIIFEDYSAKNFKRPAWSAMMVRIKRNKLLQPNQILFTTWDRFSRNIGDAYYMIAQLERLNIRAQATEQELDFAIPENKIILAVYLASSQAENERRSISIRQGIKKARQEGHWTSNAPFGYSRQFSTIGKKSVVIKEPEASYVKSAFGLLAEGVANTKSVYDKLKLLGMECSISHFWRIIKNPFYCGQVAVPGYADEKPHLADGIHQGLVSKLLFYKVQDILDSRKHKTFIRPQKETLLFRGFLYCPICNSKLTGSASKGKSKHYYYYHCRSKCGFRVRAERINETLFLELAKLTADKPYADLYKKVIKTIREEFFEEQSVTQRSFSVSIDKLIGRVLKANELLLKGKIEAEDFRLIRNDCEKSISLIGLEMDRVTSAMKENEISLNKAVLDFTYPGRLLDKLELPDKLRLLKLILFDRIVASSEPKIEDITNDTVRLIYNLSSLKVSAKISYENRVKKDDFDLVSRIYDLEFEKGTAIDDDLAIKVGDFLENYAKLTIKVLF
jgi:DNA invertase Pin-like site-specific DNA recombinase